MALCDEQEFVTRAAPLHQVVPPTDGKHGALWGALYARFPADAFTRRLGWLGRSGGTGEPWEAAPSESFDWRRWLRDGSWVDGSDGADSLGRWAAARLPAPVAGWAESVGHDLRRHLAGEVAVILASVGGGGPRHGATGEELTRLAERRPALARLVGTRVELWIGATAELLSRYHRDRADIVAGLFDGCDPGPLVGIEAGLGDSHNGFRTVAALTFAGGGRVVYKPRSIDVEGAWAGLVQWINTEAREPRVRAQRVLPRHGYGWAEYVAPGGSHDEGADSLTWYRGGWLLALLHALGASDCHGGNVVLAGDWPYVIDLETLLTPGHRLEGLVEAGRSAAAVATARRLRRSVLGVSVLPAWVPVEGGELYLGSLDIPVAGPGRERFRDGFVDGYRFLLQRQAVLLAPGGPLGPLESVEVRVILRPTRLYSSLQRASLAAGGVTGVTRSLAFETLVAPLLDLDDRTGAAVAEAEIAALDAGDVPRFVVRADSRDARGGRRAIPGLCPDTAWSELRSRIGGLSTEGLASQLALVDLSLDVAAARVAPVAPAEHPTAERSVDPEELQRVAADLAGELARTAERGSDGSAAWVGLAFDPSAGAPAILPTDAGLYSGGAGIAIFLAAAAQATGREEFAELALAALAPHPRQSDAAAARAFRALPVGGYVGLASILYGWAAVGRLLDRGDLVEAAVERSALLTDERVMADTRLDRIGGVAGAIPVLVGLHRRSPEPFLLDRIRVCGERLLLSAQPVGDGALCWPGPDGVALCGISHGAAGITLSLVQAWEATGEAAFRDAAEAGRRFEDGQFDPGRGNWPDRRGAGGGPGVGDTCSWCHGAPGIALARAALADLVPAAGENGMLEAALATTRDRRRPGGHLCCGEAGIADILLEVGRRRDRPDLI
ncbi:MAG: type 2 lanthipeptide synthetase LanM family protein, partial [Actinomycetota bacterium]|nr:type 2 lanthipeptide synthetase LanM family protein [Actinomycetota bacterium]